MGKLTDSLGDSIEELNHIQAGINRMGALGASLYENTFEVADAALCVGYAASQAQPKQVTPCELDEALDEATVVENEKLPKGAIQWSKEILITRFKSHHLAYKYLVETYDIQPSSRKWVDIIAAFNGKKLGALGEVPSDSRLNHLEQRLTALEVQMQQITICLKELMKIIDSNPI